MDTSAWQHLLSRKSRSLIDDGRLPSGGEIPAAAAATGWLGSPPATDAAIAAAEARLGVKFPASLAAFYRVSNGWEHDLTTYGGLVLLPVEQIGWYRDLVDESYLSEENLERALMISTEGEEGAVWILDPQVSGRDGEWAASCPECVEGTGWMPGGLPALFGYFED